MSRPFQATVTDAFSDARARAQSASRDGDAAAALLWRERAWRVSGKGHLPALEFVAELAKSGDPRATALLIEAAERRATFPILFALAAAYRRDRCLDLAVLATERLLRTVALDAIGPAAALAADAANSAGLPGWMGWRQGRLLLGGAGVTPTRSGSEQARGQCSSTGCRSRIASGAQPFRMR